MPSFWQHATKETHPSLPTVELAAYLAVSHFNDGSDSFTLVLKELRITPRLHCSIIDCVIPAERALISPRRENIRNWKKGYSDHLDAIEGPQYEARTELIINFKCFFLRFHVLDMFSHCKHYLKNHLR